METFAAVKIGEAFKVLHAPKDITDIIDISNTILPT